MTDDPIIEHPIDPELNRRLKQLQAVPPRNPETAARGKAIFMAEVDEIVKAQGFSRNDTSTGGMSFYKRWKEKWNMATPRFRTVFSLVAAFMLLAVFLFGGAGMTAYASQSALPGDALYGIKTSVEQTRVTLARDAAEKAQLNLAFAERRLDEIARLIANGRYADIAQAVQEYEQYVQSAIAALETVAAGDPASAQQLASQVAILLKRYAETLSGMVNALPDTARGEVERAIQVSNDASSFSDEVEFTGMVEAITADSWVVGGRTLALTTASEIKGTIVVGNLVKVHALQDAEGNLILREVELATGDDLNENGNGNENDDSGEDGNSNDVNENEASEDDHEFTGVVEQIGADFWVISGQMLSITSGSEIDGTIQVGDLVKVETTLDDSGTVVLREVKLASDEDSNGNDANDNGDDQGDDNQNGNENEDNANGNINENDNGDDDHNANVNENDNGDANDNGNVNDNVNTNDDDSNENDNGNTNDSGDDDNENSNENGGEDPNDNGNENSSYED